MPETSFLLHYPPPQGYPQRFIPDTFCKEPFADNFEERKSVFLIYICQNPAQENFKAIYTEMARLACGQTPHSGVLFAALDYLDARKDCADFVLQAVLRLLYQFAASPLMPDGWLERAKASVLGFKYWPDEPGVDSMCTWTENHQILFSTGAILAGQLYPREVFTNSGQSGEQKIEVVRRRILRWLDLRFRSGFSEWLSHVYYDEDLTALLNLVDFCTERQISEQAKKIIHLLLLDMALQTYKGVYGCTHGRSYANGKRWVVDETTTDTGKLLFGVGVFARRDNMSAVQFALSENYQIPQVIYEIAHDVLEDALEIRQRMGICMKDLKTWNLDAKDPEDGMLLLTLEAYLHPRLIQTTMQLFDRHNWWENEFFAPFRKYRRLLNVLRTTRTLPILAAFAERDLCRNTREEVNTYTYKTQDYMLSTAQDYRTGYGGDQQHIWQATLGANAVCFTTHPANLETDGPSPNYWTGSGLLPRAAQYRNVAIIVYKIEKIPALYVPTRHFFTHAWLPRDAFDEVSDEIGGWYFARKGDGYLGLYSQKKAAWQGTNELIAPGANNIWICQMGSVSESGSFEDFIEQVVAARVEFDGMRVNYHSPSIGEVRFGWRGSLSVDGEVMPLHDYPRYDSRFVQADFDPQQVHVQCGGNHWTINLREEAI
ncbi:MAG: hypothetical protein CVU39_08670 [Chloroflexi bacterium HGW-Chloroflexi-10]|nr:MAG: hypothetical protein CVU39_08670 [Chloroflexi bacterium HGW-Chloroflexi-10]